MLPRTTTSIVLLTALMAGTISPVAACALMCERQSRANAHQHCGQDSDPMPGMLHDHSAVHRSAVGDKTLVVRAPSCQSDCVVAERLNTSRKLVPRVTVVQTDAIVLDPSPKCLDRDLESAWSLDDGPPSFPSAQAASFSILRI
jgi:hypothetical protein